MTYSPGSPGYPPAQPAGSYPGATPSFTNDDPESKFPLYLTVVVMLLGLLVYVLNFFPTFVLSADLGPAAGGRAGDAGTAVAVAVLAALLAGLSLLPKAKKYTGVVAAIAVLGALMWSRRSSTRPPVSRSAGRCGPCWVPACSRPWLPSPRPCWRGASSPPRRRGPSTTLTRNTASTDSTGNT